jgi:hypothetical protein
MLISSFSRKIALHELVKWIWSSASRTSLGTPYPVQKVIIHGIDIKPLAPLIEIPFARMNVWWQFSVDKKSGNLFIYAHLHAIPVLIQTFAMIC